MSSDRGTLERAVKFTRVCLQSWIVARSSLQPSRSTTERILKTRGMC